MCDSVLSSSCRAPLKMLCDNMKYQIISRAFYGCTWSVTVSTDEPLRGNSSIFKTLVLYLHVSVFRKKGFGVRPVIRLSWQQRHACDVICSQLWLSDLRLQVFVFAPDGMRWLFKVFHGNCSNRARHLESRIESRSRRSLQFQLLPRLDCQKNVSQKFGNKLFSVNSKLPLQQLREFRARLLLNPPPPCVSGFKKDLII